MQLGILDGAEGVDDLGRRGDGHGQAGLSGDFSLRAIGRIPGWRASPPSGNLTPSRFSSAVSAITARSAIPTRRQIYLFAHKHADGVTATEVAEHFGLHPNVARHHLDKLAAGGYLEVAVHGRERPRRRPALQALPAPPTGGRRSTVAGAARRRWSLTLLGRALALLPPEQAEAMAEEVGDRVRPRHGRSRSAGGRRRSVRSATRSHAVADALTAHGFAAHTEKARRRAAHRDRPLPLR